jgi:hypothetical protein
MILDREYDDFLERQKDDAERILRSHLEPQLHPSPERLRIIADEWALKHWWTAQECAALLMGADPVSSFFAENFPIYVAEKSDREKFARLLDLVQRRFGDRVNPGEACRWAASKGMKQKYLEQALAGRGADEHVANDRPQQSSKPRQEDTTKRDITRSRLIRAVAMTRGFQEGKHNNAVGIFKNDLEKIGQGKMNEKTIRECIVDASKHAQTNKSFAEYCAEKRELCVDR